jgi:hypothetical protein
MPNPRYSWIDPGTVQADIDGDGDLGGVAASPPEWPMLKLGNGRIGG